MNSRMLSALARTDQYTHTHMSCHVYACKGRRPNIQLSTHATGRSTGRDIGGHGNGAELGVPGHLKFPVNANSRESDLTRGE